jgi:integrase
MIPLGSRADNFRGLAHRRGAFSLLGTALSPCCLLSSGSRVRILPGAPGQRRIQSPDSSAQISHNVLVRVIRHAERDDLVARNVAALVKPPKGQRMGRPSKALTLEQAATLMDAAKGTQLEAYVTLSLLTGLRTEEARALRWDQVVAWAGDQWQPVAEAGFDHEQLAVFVWRSDRTGGDTRR